MNVKDLIRNIRKKPKAFVHEVRADYIEYVIEGFLVCNTMYDRADEEERSYHFYFIDWITEWIHKNIDKKYQRKSALWHQVLRDVTNDEQEAVDLFFKLSELYFEQYEKRRKILDKHMFIDESEKIIQEQLD